MSLDRPQRCLCPFLKIIQITRKTQTYDQTIRPACRPYDSNLVVGYADLPFLAHSPALHHLSSFRIPDLHRLIRTTRNKSPRILRPRYSEDTPRMFSLPNLRLGLPCLAIIQPYFLIGAYADQRPPVRTESHPIDIPLMFPQTRVEFKWHPMIKYQTSIITPRRRPQRSLLPYTHAIDLTAMPTDLTHGIATIGRDAVSELLLSVANGYDSLAVSVPSEIVDAAADDWVFALGGTFADTVPDADGTRDITAGNIVAGRGEAGDGCGGRVGGILG